MRFEVLELSGVRTERSVALVEVDDSTLLLEMILLSFNNILTLVL